ncbi:MAG: ankyrin repeat domain-containing protein, partial [Methanosarcinaceae archaeon]
ITALMKASEGGHTAVISLLLEKGADPTLVNRDGKTALYLAIKAGYGEIAKMLRKRVLGNKKVQSTS